MLILIAFTLSILLRALWLGLILGFRNSYECISYGDVSILKRVNWLG